VAQNREAPAYQEYAAAMLAKLPFRLLSLQDRGLLWTIRLECWVNNRLPANPQKLATVLGLNFAEVSESLPRIMAFLRESDGFITCPELEDYRSHLEESRKRMSEGGKKSSARRKLAQEEKQQEKNQRCLGPPSQGAYNPLVQNKPKQHSQEQLIDESPEVQQFLDEMDSYDREFS